MEELCHIKPTVNPHLQRAIQLGKSNPLGTVLAQFLRTVEPPTVLRRIAAHRTVKETMILKESSIVEQQKDTGFSKGKLGGEHI